LIATANFPALPAAVTSGFILPDNFLDPAAASIELNFGPDQDVINLTGDDVPSDGAWSIDDNLNSMTNSPTNFAGETGSVNIPGVLIFNDGFEF